MQNEMYERKNRMTREEAIKEMIRAYDVLDFSCHMDNRRKEAFNMAKVALEQEPSEDAISRQAVLKAMCDASIPIIYKGKPSFVVDYVGVIETVPLVNPKETKTDSWSIKDVADTLARHGLIVAQEPKTGHWIDRHIIANRTFDMIVCSECGNEFSFDAETGISEYNYCPNCGARMVKSQERSDKCSKCEYHINPDYTRCKECGAERSEKE